MGRGKGKEEGEGEGEGGGGGGGGEGEGEGEGGGEGRREQYNTRILFNASILHNLSINSSSFTFECVVSVFSHTQRNTCSRQV